MRKQQAIAIESRVADLRLRPLGTGSSTTFGLAEQSHHALVLLVALLGTEN